MVETGKKETTRTVDEIINEIGKSPNLLIFVVASCAMSCSYVAAFHSFMVQFTGFIPNEEYMCISQECLDLKRSFTSELGEGIFKLYSVTVALFQRLDIIVFSKMVKYCA